ncbi:hypothetical protein WPS_27610 [Vulcanimicrobium alpinum]|uniref:Uncharacterized protein n=1 Tax=Vulcanimicrobium alpinum TaxID=3016050 RepID=A0AAN2CAB3_UNVUL|nr:hypothetical protein WPS_27610 [Vulcanimicrobium alpinum]
MRSFVEFDDAVGVEHQQRFRFQRHDVRPQLEVLGDAERHGAGAGTQVPDRTTPHEQRFWVSGVGKREFAIREVDGREDRGCVARALISAECGVGPCEELGRRGPERGLAPDHRADSRHRQCRREVVARHVSDRKSDAVIRQGKGFAPVSAVAAAEGRHAVRRHGKAVKGKPRRLEVGAADSVCKH